MKVAEISSTESLRTYADDFRKIATVLRTPSDNPLDWSEAYAVSEELPPPAPLALTGGPGDAMRKIAHALRQEAAQESALRREKIALAIQAAEGLTLLRDR